MAGDPGTADHLRQQAQACRWIASERLPRGRAALLMEIANFFDADARRIDRAQDRTR